MVIGVGSSHFIPKPNLIDIVEMRDVPTVVVKRIGGLAQENEIKYNQEQKSGQSLKKSHLQNPNRHRS